MIERSAGHRSKFPSMTQDRSTDMVRVLLVSNDGLIFETLSLERGKFKCVCVWSVCVVVVSMIFNFQLFLAECDACVVGSCSLLHSRM